MARTGLLFGALIWRAVRYQQGCWQRIRLFTAVASVLLMTHPAGAHTRSIDRTSPVTIRIPPGDWGNTPINDLQMVLDAVASRLGAHFGDRSIGTIDVVPGTNGPLVLYERNADGAYVVQLSARNGRWYQFVYQFSHELCHIYSNFDNKDSPDAARGNQWFEESICEAAALFTLRQLSAQWALHPPAEEWREHAADLQAYAEYFLHEPHRRLPATKSFATWFRANQPDLHANPYFRDKNELVSNLLLPLFEQNPDDWGAIGFLNHRRDLGDKSFPEFLEAWYTACPESYHKVVGEIMNMFGSVPLGTRLAASEQTVLAASR